MSKSHGKGHGITLSTAGEKQYFDRILANVSEGLPMPEFKPLRSYPATAHPRQSEIDAFCRAPSRFA